MKVDLLHYSAPPIVGGVESVISHHAGLMSKAGHRVRILAGAGMQTDPRIPFIQIPLLDSRNPEILSIKAELDKGSLPPELAEIVHRLSQCLEETITDTDCLIAHNVCSLHKNLALTAALWQLANQPSPPRLILWHHDLAWTTPRYSAELHPGYPWDLLRTDWPGAVQVVVSELRRGELAELLGVPNRRITVIPNAVDTREFSFGAQPDAELRRGLGLDGKTVIGFAGSFYAYEGLDLLIEAAATLAPRRPDLRVLLVGGGPQETALKAQAIRCGLADSVIFTGRVPHDDVHRYYDLIDVLAYPRHRMRLTDIVTPLKPLEAMAQGRMFVASDVGGHRELVRHDETGFLFPAGDARALADSIERVLERKHDWPRVREHARRFVETERTWARSVARYADVYQALRTPDSRAAHLKHRGT